MEMAPIGARRQMLGVAQDVVGVQELLDGLEQRPVERRRSPERQRQPVANERKALGQGAERASITSADVDPVLGGHLEEVDTLGDLVIRDELGHEGSPQPQPSAFGPLLAGMGRHRHHAQSAQSAQSRGRATAGKRAFRFRR